MSGYVLTEQSLPSPSLSDPPLLGLSVSLSQNKYINLKKIKKMSLAVKNKNKKDCRGLRGDAHKPLCKKDLT